MILMVLANESLTDEHAITKATWVLVIATFLLASATIFLWLDSLNKGKEQRERWKQEDKVRDDDRRELQARWVVEDDLRQASIKEKMLAELYAEFANPEMMRARTRFACHLFAWNSITRFQTSVGPVGFADRGPGLPLHGGQKIIDFFAEVDRALNSGSIDMSGLNRKFGDYILRFVEASSYREPQSLELARSLQQKVKAYRQANRIPEPDSELAVRKSYWYYAIDRDLVATDA